MRREEPRTGRIADYEFQFWECWESDDKVSGTPERHWFRSDDGLEAPAYDDMLQKLYLKEIGNMLQGTENSKAAEEAERLSATDHLPSATAVEPPLSNLETSVGDQPSAGAAERLPDGGHHLLPSATELPLANLPRAIRDLEPSGNKPQPSPVSSSASSDAVIPEMEIRNTGVATTLAMDLTGLNARTAAEAPCALSDTSACTMPLPAMLATSRKPIAAPANSGASISGCGMRIPTRKSMSP